MKTPVVEVERVCTAPSQLPPRKGPEVAVVGRSNVGKSTLVNALLNRPGLLRTSRTPGRTQAVIFVRVGEKGYVVDLPGYGYAKVPESVRRSWAGLVNGYLESRRGQTALLLVDVRREPGEDERQLMEWFRRYEWTVQVVLTKSDKLPRGKRTAAERNAAKALGLETGREPLLFSAVTGEGLKALRAIVERSMEPRT
ncbi:MAG: ribosome biogenesis GTP-binding protein YihA/YsxC [Acidobacteriota bacterium]